MVAAHLLVLVQRDAGPVGQEAHGVDEVQVVHGTHEADGVAPTPGSRSSSRALSALTLKEGVFSVWKGQRPVAAPRPTRRSATYCCTTSARGDASRYPLDVVVDDPHRRLRLPAAPGWSVRAGGCPGAVGALGESEPQFPDGDGGSGWPSITIETAADHFGSEAHVQRPVAVAHHDRQELLAEAVQLAGREVGEHRVDERRLPPLREVAAGGVPLAHALEHPLVVEVGQS